jgi:ABC-type dipeptide/oligopeptide/nickel transport system ATPase component
METEPRAPTPADDSGQGNALLTLRDVSVSFGDAPAVLRSVDLCIRAGEVVALVGESGAGKTLLSLACLGLLPRRATITGQVQWEERVFSAADRDAFAPLRGKEVSMVFQDPQASLNPLYTVRDQMEWILRHHRKMDNAEITPEALRLLAAVRLSDPERVLKSYPNELSGGMCQRVMIAMALSSRPRLLIADEPTSALDTSVGAGIVRLLAGIQEEFGLAILLVTHDLGVAGKLANRALVMENGSIVEEGTVNSLLTRAEHPASRNLIEAYHFMKPTFDLHPTATTLH